VLGRVSWMDLFVLKGDLQIVASWGDGFVNVNQGRYHGVTSGSADWLYIFARFLARFLATRRYHRGGSISLLSWPLSGLANGYIHFKLVLCVEVPGIKIAKAAALQNYTQAAAT
jgi:hypothetical protein